MRVFFIRHGETDFNKKKLIQGRTDNELNETGKKQACEMTNKVDNNIKIDYVYSSPLIRAKQTSEIFLNCLNIKKDIIIDDNLLERDFGSLEGKEIMNFFEIENNNKYDHEKNSELENRIDNFLKKIIKKHKDSDIIFAFSHSHTLKSLMVKYFNYTYKMSLPNCAIIELEIKNRDIKLIDIY